MKITDLSYAAGRGINRIKNPWRADLQKARFRKAFFHVDGSIFDNGRRVVMHEFPKKNLPYAEDMGRRAYEFTVRGYCISYIADNDTANTGGSELFKRDYRIARDILVEELSSGEPGKLYLPTRLPSKKIGEIIVICPRYRLTEEEKLGGYCTFDMTFVELGVAPQAPPPDARQEVIKNFDATRERAVEQQNASPSTEANV